MQAAQAARTEPKLGEIKPQAPAAGFNVATAYVDEERRLNPAATSAETLSGKLITAHVYGSRCYAEAPTCCMKCFLPVTKNSVDTRPNCFLKSKKRPVADSRIRNSPCRRSAWHRVRRSTILAGRPSPKAIRYRMFWRRSVPFPYGSGGHHLRGAYRSRCACYAPSGEHCFALSACWPAGFAVSIPFCPMTLP